MRCWAGDWPMTRGHTGSWIRSHWPASHRIVVEHVGDAESVGEGPSVHGPHMPGGLWLTFRLPLFDPRIEARGGIQR